MLDTLKSIAQRYPPEMRADQLADVPRIAFNISLALNGRAPSEVAICDIGGGLGLFSTACVALGFKRVVLVDDFRDPINATRDALQIHHDLGVECVIRDAVTAGISDLGQFDAITSFDSMEHWHNSPRRLFRDAFGALTPRAVFVLGVPNCVNLRKRLTVPLGIGKWSGMSDWYDSETFRGHVREPDVGDLFYIARDMGLKATSIHGRNWLGYQSSSRWVRLASSLIDRPLRHFPRLCSDIYLVGHGA